MGAPIIELPEFPLTEVYVDKKVEQKLGFVDQAFHYCNHCGHGQIENIIEPKFLYENSYETRTSTSSSAIGAITIFIDFINKNLEGKKLKNIVEIGCNDIYTLERLESRADKLYGIDPILKGIEENYNNEKITIIGDYFENFDLNSLGIDLDVVISSHTLEHISQPKTMIKNIIDNATEETLIFFQFPGLEGLIGDSRFDQIFHQHYNYFSLQSVIYMLDDLDLELIDFNVNLYHWNTLMIAFRKKKTPQININEKYKSYIKQITKSEILSQYKTFRDCMSATNNRLRYFKNERIYGYGAALMLPVLDYHLEDGLSQVKCILDEDNNKIHKYYLNVPLQVLHPNDIDNIEDCVILVTAFNSLDAIRKIIPKLITLNISKIITPLNLL